MIKLHNFSTKCVVDHNLPGTVRLLLHYLYSLGADLYLIAVGNVPFRPSYGNVTGLYTVHRPDLHFALDSKNSPHGFFKLLLAAYLFAWLRYDNTRIIIHIHYSGNIPGIKSGSQCGMSVL